MPRSETSPSFTGNFFRFKLEESVLNAKTERLRQKRLKNIIKRELKNPFSFVDSEIMSALERTLMDFEALPAELYCFNLGVTSSMVASQVKTQIINKLKSVHMRWGSGSSPETSLDASSTDEGSCWSETLSSHGSHSAALQQSTRTSLPKMEIAFLLS